MGALFSQITESLRRFGISEAVSHVLVARYGATAEEVRSPARTSSHA